MARRRAQGVVSHSGARFWASARVRTKLLPNSVGRLAPLVPGAVDEVGARPFRRHLVRHVLEPGERAAVAVDRRADDRLLRRPDLLDVPGFAPAFPPLYLEPLALAR